MFPPLMSTHIVTPGYLSTIKTHYAFSRYTIFTSIFFMADPEVSIEIFALCCCERAEMTLTRLCVYMLVLSNNLVS